MIKALTLEVDGRGLHEFTPAVLEQVRKQAMQNGLATLYIKHTSASLLIQENADPSVLHDLQQWMEQHVPEGDPRYTHTAEGPDDMPAHIRSALTATSLCIPILSGQLALGTWQGIFLWEHRLFKGAREVLLHLRQDD